MDGEATRVDTASAAGGNGQVLFLRTFPATGTHRLELRVAGTSGLPVVLDALVIRTGSRAVDAATASPAVAAATAATTPSPAPTAAGPTATTTPADPTSTPASPTASPTPASPTAAPTAAPTSTATASPRPTPTPTPRPTPTPTPRPTPTPTPRPTPTPTPTPAAAGCDATFGQAPSSSSDQSSAIASFLRSNKGRTVCFTKGTYRVDAQLEIQGWSGTIVGNGSTFRRYSTSAHGSIIRMLDSSGIAIDNLSVMGPASLSFIQTRTFGSGDREDEHAISIESVSNLTIRGGRFTNTYGDAFYVRSHYDSSPVPTNVLLSGVVMDINGRNNISVISARSLRLTGSRGSNASLHGFDAEPNRSTDVLDGIRIDTTSFSTFDAAHTSSGPGYAVAISPGYANVQARNIDLVNLTMDKAMVLVTGYDSGHPASDVTISGCRPSTSSGRGALLEHIRGLSFTNNGLLEPHLTDVS